MADQKEPWLHKNLVPGLALIATIVIGWNTIQIQQQTITLQQKSNQLQIDITDIKATQDRQLAQFTRDLTSARLYVRRYLSAADVRYEGDPPADIFHPIPTTSPPRIPDDPLENRLNDMTLQIENVGGAQADSVRLDLLIDPDRSDVIIDKLSLDSPYSDAHTEINQEKTKASIYINSLPANDTATIHAYFISTKPVDGNTWDLVFDYDIDRVGTHKMIWVWRRSAQRWVATMLLQGVCKTCVLPSIVPYFAGN